jgi:hypothetical protein
MTDPDDPRKLTPTRIFLIAFVVVALGIAAWTIAASLGVWQENDAAVTAPASN